VQTPAERMEKVAAVSQRALSALTLARQFGAVPFQIKGKDLPTAVAGFVKEYGITHIVVGRSRRPPWWKFFTPP
jgi:two-component system sensor histidine kinase KdpD